MGSVRHAHDPESFGIDGHACREHAVVRMAHATLGIGVTETAGLIGYAPYLGEQALGRDA